ncbi:2OG-Fe(II) oxygenase family protein [Enterobacter cloacae]|uniref:2OG-Fe(II) oxygenase family protein n=1 Tax=Enterobacter cloacae TaxID=550 RepID=UPI00345C84C5
MICVSELILLRFVHYPPLPGNKNSYVVRTAKHTDINWLTILPVETQSGLQNLDHDNHWDYISCNDDVLIITVGDMLAEASQGYYRPTPHCVIHPAGKDAKKYEWYYHYFYMLAPNVVLSER